jgi:hypothetical protein
MTTDQTMQQRIEALVEWSIIHREKIFAGLLACIICVCIGRYFLTTMITLGQTPLEGTVSYNGVPIGYGTVTLVTEDHEILHATIAPDGRYKFPHVPDGRLRVAVSSPNPQSVFEQKPVSSPARLTPRGATASEPLHRGDRGVVVAERLGATTVSLPASTAFPAVASRSEQQKEWRPIPGRYANPATSGLVIDIATGTRSSNLTWGQSSATVPNEAATRTSGR